MIIYYSRFYRKTHNLLLCETIVVMHVWCDHQLSSTALSVDRRATPALMNTNRSVIHSSATRTNRRCNRNRNYLTNQSYCNSNWYPHTNMESPPEPVTLSDKSASEAGASLEDSPVKPDSKAETDKPAPVKRQSCSSTNKGKPKAKQKKNDVKWCFCFIKLTGIKIWLCTGAWCWTPNKSLMACESDMFHIIPEFTVDLTDENHVV